MDFAAWGYYNSRVYRVKIINGEKREKRIQAKYNSISPAMRKNIYKHTKFLGFGNFVFLQTPDDG
jgi:hypothetical protein